MSRNGKTSRGAPPFSLYERLIAGRLLFATRKDGGVALMSIIAFVGVALAVAALIAVMSIMNGFRYELVSRLLGVDGHVYVQAPNMSLEEAAKLQEALTFMAKNDFEMVFSDTDHRRAEGRARRNKEPSVLLENNLRKETDKRLAS